MMNTEIFNRYPELKSVVSELVLEIKHELIQCQRPPSEIVLDDCDICRLLKIGKRKLAYLRERKEITYYKPDGKIYYLLSDVLEYCKKNKVESDIKTARFFKIKK